MAPADCPIPPCDCASNVPKGTIIDVAKPGLAIDSDYPPVPGSGEGGQPVLTFRGTVAADKVAALERAPGVIKVWSDAPIEPFSGGMDN